MTLENFDFAFQPSIDRRQIETLASCAFVRDATTLLVQGAPGLGKTHLCVALGVKAIEHGFTRRFLLIILAPDRAFQPGIYTLSGCPVFGVHFSIFPYYQLDSRCDARYSDVLATI